MPRNHGYYGNNPSTAATIVAADRILQKQTTYRQNIEKLHSHSCMFAEFIAISGEIETLLQNDDPVDASSDSDPTKKRKYDAEKEENRIFLDTQRETLKAITEGHVHSKRYVDALMQATNAIKAEMANGAAVRRQDPEEEEKKDSASNDYEFILQSKIEIQKHEIEKNALAMQHEDMIRKVRQKLNEKIPSNRSTNGDDDDEIEVEMTQQNQESAMKCPLTGLLFEDPVKNKVCGHVYDRAALLNHLRIKRACPVIGCSNQHVTRDQVEPDEEMKLKVRRFKRVVEEQRRRNLASQDYDVDDDEEEEDHGGNHGMTVIE